MHLTKGAPCQLQAINIHSSCAMTDRALLAHVQAALLRKLLDIFLPEPLQSCLLEELLLCLQPACRQLQRLQLLLQQILQCQGVLWMCGNYSSMTSSEGTLCSASVQNEPWSAGLLAAACLKGCDVIGDPVCSRKGASTFEDWFRQCNIALIRLGPHVQCVTACSEN